MVNSFSICEADRARWLQGLGNKGAHETLSLCPDQSVTLLEERIIQNPSRTLVPPGHTPLGSQIIALVGVLDGVFC